MDGVGCLLEMYPQTKSHDLPSNQGAFKHLLAVGPQHCPATAGGIYFRERLTPTLPIDGRACMMLKGPLLHLFGLKICIETGINLEHRGY